MEGTKEKNESSSVETNSEFEKQSKESETSSSQKNRKKYEWTPKRKEAFAKMREGLETKVQLTKQIKQEKKLAEKEELKRRIREIMHQGGKSESSKSKSKSKSKMESSSEESEVSSDESSQDEALKRKKEKKHRSADTARTKKSSKQEKPKKRKARETSSESEGVEQSSDSSSSEEDVRAKHTQSASRHQLEQYRQNKVQSGKAQKQTPYLNPMDRFICL
jgi:hypothetical protein